MDSKECHSSYVTGFLRLNLLSSNLVNHDVLQTVLGLMLGPKNKTVNVAQL